MRYWWVNQNQTYAHEVGGGFLWSPKTRSDGVRNYFYDTMNEVRPGDMVFSFCDTFIRAIGIVQLAATSAPKPEAFGASGNAWSDDGWLVEVEFVELRKQVRPKDLMSALRPLLPGKYAPLQPNGNGNQGVYLTELSKEFAAKLGSFIGAEFTRIGDSATALDATPSDVADDQAEEILISRIDLPETERQQLIKARRGQGFFRSRVRLVESRCRVTGVEDPQHLRASHIKPWRDADDREKLDGNNGLMLSPHVDHLFDQGFISFEDDGRLMVSRLLARGVLASWGIDSQMNVGAFNVHQAKFLAVHRQTIFRQ